MADLLEKILKYAGPKGTLVRRGELSAPKLRYRIVSVDDHLVEPPDLFEKRLPARLQSRAPRVERDDLGIDYWIFEDERVPLLGADGIRGWEVGKGYLGPVNFDELHPAVWNIHERVRHMDAIGVEASLCFPSAPFGFAGWRFLRMKDRELGLASLRAFNDWTLEVWAGTYPGRMIPCQLAWLADPVLAAEEIRRNAARGFTSVSFSENPEKLGLPSLYSRDWDPFFRACEETGTVLNLHVGSSSETIVPSRDSSPAVLGALFPINGMATATDWLFAGIPVRFPQLKIAMSEGGIGWVPILVDRIEYMARVLDYSKEFGPLSPIDVLRRNFWFTTFSDPSTLPLRGLVGVDHIMVETDYPHTDSSFPETQDLLASHFQGIPRAEIEQMTHENARRLYRLEPRAA
ncbi:MAG: amidohydrolase [Deltaproteobacteria bacterium]|nr:amidohydrolase [Deltaproteobacteria bacterium]